jgi:hypothetical protein
MSDEHMHRKRREEKRRGEEPAAWCILTTAHSGEKNTLRARKGKNRIQDKRGERRRGVKDVCKGIIDLKISAVNVMNPTASNTKPRM